MLQTLNKALAKLGLYAESIHEMGGIVIKNKASLLGEKIIEKESSIIFLTVTACEEISMFTNFPMTLSYMKDISNVLQENEQALLEYLT